MDKIKFLIYFLVFFGYENVFSQKINTKQIQDFVKDWHKSPKMQSSSLSFYAQSSKENKPLISYQSSQSLSPASCLKLVVSGAALGILGENFRFETHLAYSGSIKKGVLEGNLYIIGGGDPTLGVENLEKLMQEWVQIIKKQGIKQIKGKIIGDESIFETNNLPDGWAWSDIGNYYGAGASGLSVLENQFLVTFRTGRKVGDKTEILRTEPAMPTIEWTNEVRTAATGTGDQSYIYGSPYTYVRHAGGTLPINSQNAYTVKASMPDPALFFAELFQKKLQQATISSQNATTIRILQTKQPNFVEKRTIFYTHKSTTLKEIIKPLNQKSINLYAENLARMIGYKQEKKGTLKAGIKAIMEFWKGKKIDLQGFYMEDAAGLSRFNYLTTQQLSQILISITKMPFWNTFYESLAVAGKSGTLQFRCLRTAAVGNLRAKSGSIGKVRSFAGYVRTKSGILVAFSVIVNNYDAPDYEVMQNLEKLMAMLAELP